MGKQIKSIVHRQNLILFIILAVLFILTLHPLVDFDTFFGLKIGELVIKTGQIPSKEVFSWAAFGREWIAYEWLAQTWVYLLNQIGGFAAIQAYVALTLILFFFIVFLINFKVLNRSFMPSLFMALFTYASVYEFFVARPQIIAFLCFVIIMYLILKFIFTGKSWLWASLPVIYIWTNSHASFIFAPYLLFGYSICGWLYFKNKNRAFAAKSFKTFLLFGFLSFAVTLLPPLFYKPYLLLWQFTNDLSFMTHFVSEWQALSSDYPHQLFYNLLFSLTLITSLFYSYRAKKWPSFILTLPLWGIALASFQAVRHVPFGTISLIIILSIFIPSSIKPKHTRKTSLLLFLLGFLILAVSSFMIYQKRESMFDQNWNFPQKSIEFLKTHELKGKMFNEFAVGGYLIYNLYPQYQVFFDGRADIYHCCEMRDFWPLIVDKHTSKDQFKKDLYQFLDKYKFSFILIPSNSYNPLEFTASGLMADTLSDDPNWRLIYFSDRMQILVKNDGKNDQIFKSMGDIAATPYRLKPYKKNDIDRALLEYKRMISILDSGIARSGLGFILLEKNQPKQAKINFDKAISLNENLGNPYLGLGKIEIKEGNPDLAVSDLKKAVDISPFLGEAHFLLGQTYLQKGESSLAKKAWDEGLKNNIDFISRQKIIEAENNP